MVAGSAEPVRQRVGQRALRLLPPATVGVTPSATLWLCLYLPRLAIEVVCRHPSHPAVVTEQAGARTLVYSVNHLARARGIAAGHSLSSALALVADLHVYQRQPKKERQRLHHLASLSYRHLSSVVSLDYSSSLMIEIGHSRRLWQHLEEIKQCVHEWLRANRLNAAMAWAPTSRAAYWLARAGISKPVLSIAQLSAALKEVSLGHVMDTAGLKKFHNSGLKTVGDVQRMPRDGLARRGGLNLLNELDEALGRKPKLLNRWYPLPYFLQAQELALASSDIALLRPVVAALLESLACFLRQRQSMTCRLQLRFLHLHEAATVMVLGFAHYVTKAPDMLRVFDARLSRYRFNAEVLAVELCCRQLHTVAEENKDFLRLQSDGKDNWAQLQDLLTARLGEACFRPLISSQDHRPEQAAKAGQAPAMVAGVLPRPLWLLGKAQALTAIHGKPYWRGRLYLQTVAERIEQGWWQGDDVRRDYFVARTDAGATVWVYYDLRQQQWFLHGLFG